MQFSEHSGARPASSFFKNVRKHICLRGAAPPPQAPRRQAGSEQHGRGRHHTPRHSRCPSLRPHPFIFFTFCSAPSQQCSSPSVPRSPSRISLFFNSLSFISPKTHSSLASFLPSPSPRSLRPSPSPRHINYSPYSSRLH